MKSFALILYIVFWTLPAYASQKNSMGEIEVETMMQDRPHMKYFKNKQGKIITLNKSAPFISWVIKAYNTEVNGQLIYWDSDASVDVSIGILANHTIPNDKSVGQIRVRKFFKDWDNVTRKASFEELWSACVFELINIQSASKFMSIHDLALQGKLSKENWVKRNTQTEYFALVELNKFYNTVWQPWAKKNNFESNSYIWRADLPSTYEEWIAIYYQSESSYIKHYEDRFDESIIPYLKANNITLIP